MAGFFGKFFGSTVSEAAAYGIGGALQAPLEPVLQEFTNLSWRAGVAGGVTAPLEPGDAADIVAEDVELQGWGADQAAQTGIGGAQFDALVRAAQGAPGLSELLDLWRRGAIDDATLAHGFRKGRLETLWDGPVKVLKHVLFSAADLANGIQQGFVPNAGILPDAPSAGAPSIPQNGPLNIDPVAEAAKMGITVDQLTLMAELAGLPPGPELLQSWVRRGLITPQDLVNGIRQGHTKSEWAQPYLDSLEQVLTRHDYVAARIRGWIDDAAMYAGGELTGYDKASMDLLFKIQGRPLSFHQVWIGLARGGVYDGPTTDIAPPFLKALQESDIRPEWYNLAWAQRFTYPSAFVLRALTEAGDLTQAQADEALRFVGWPPELAASVSKSWAGGTGSSSSSPAKRFATSAVTTLSKGYISGEIDHADAAEHLTALGVSAADQTALFQTWDIQRQVVNRQLTEAQIKAAYHKGNMDEPTAIGRLEQLGLSPRDASTYLSS